MTCAIIKTANTCHCLKIQLPLSHFGFLLAQTASDSKSYIQHMSNIFFVMTQPEANTDVLKELKEKMATLASKVDEIQQAQVAGPSHMAKEGEDDDDEGPARNQVTLTQSTQAFLKMAFSSTLANTDHKSGWRVLACPTDSIRCPKLNPAIVPSDTTEADGYLSHLNQFWLDTGLPSRQS